MIPGPLIATTYGNGPFFPIVLYKHRAYPVGPEMAEAQEALALAIEVAESLRAAMRGDAPWPW